MSDIAAAAVDSMAAGDDLTDDGSGSGRTKYGGGAIADSATVLVLVSLSPCEGATIAWGNGRLVNG